MIDFFMRKPKDTLTDIDVNPTPFVDSTKEYNYEAKTAKNFTIRAKYRSGSIYMAVEKDKDIIPNVTLEAKIDSSSHACTLRSIENRSEQTSNQHTGLATNMLTLLLTIIADYNQSVAPDMVITKLTGSVNPLNPNAMQKLKKFYKKRSGLKDKHDRVYLSIDSASLRSNELLYFIHPIHHKERT